jgi:integration host factor subunit beta
VTKSELIQALAKKQSHLQLKDIELAVRCVVEQLTETIATGERIEIRGFGCFTLRQRAPRVARNPKSGEAVALSERHILHFKAGKEMRDIVDASRLKFKIVD